MKSDAEWNAKRAAEKADIGPARITEKQLFEACREIVNDDGVFQALRAHAPLPNMVKFAGEIIFMDEITGKAADVVRIAAKQLRSPGFFTFEDE